MEDTSVKISVHSDNYNPGLVDLTELLKELGIGVVYLQGDLKAELTTIPLLYDPQPDSGSSHHVSANCMGFFYRLQMQFENRGMANPFAWAANNPLSLRVISNASLQRTYAVLSAVDQRLEWLEKGAYGYPGLGTQRTYSRFTKRFRQAIDKNRALYQNNDYTRPLTIRNKRSEMMREITRIG